MGAKFSEHFGASYWPLGLKHEPTFSQGPLSSPSPRIEHMASYVFVVSICGWARTRMGVNPDLVADLVRSLDPTLRNPLNGAWPGRVPSTRIILGSLWGPGPNSKRFLLAFPATFHLFFVKLWTRWVIYENAVIHRCYAHWWPLLACIHCGCKAGLPSSTRVQARD